jgi:hypothetical protein
MAFGRGDRYVVENGTQAIPRCGGRAACERAETDLGNQGRHCSALPNQSKAKTRQLAPVW